MGRCLGVTLVETLLASSLGAVLLIALLSVYQRGVAAHAFAESRSELVETTFIAERVLVDELRGAGRTPCGPRGRRFNLVRGSAATPWLRPFTAPVQITAASVGDEVAVLKVGAPAPLAGHDPARLQLSLTHPGGFEPGDLIVVCDDDVTALLQVTGTADSGRVLGYGGGRVRPGNCSSPFLAGGCGPQGHHFAGAAFIAPYRPVVFSVRASGTNRSLYRKRLIVANTASGPAARMMNEEMVAGVVLLRAQAGAADAAGRVRLTRAPFAGQAASLDLGLALLARQRTPEVLPDEATYLLGEDVGALLPAGAKSEYLTAAHEFSVVP